MNDITKIITWCVGITCIATGFGFLLPIPGNLPGLTLQFSGILLLIISSLIPSEHKRKHTGDEISL